MFFVVSLTALLCPNAHGEATTMLESISNNIWRIFIFIYLKGLNQVSFSRHSCWCLQNTTESPKIQSVTKECITERRLKALSYATKLTCSFWAFYRFIVRRSTIVARAYQVRSLSIARTNDIRETSAIKGRAIGTCTAWIGGSASYGIHFFGRDAFVKNMYK